METGESPEFTDYPVLTTNEQLGLVSDLISKDKVEND